MWKLVVFWVALRAVLRGSGDTREASPPESRGRARSRSTVVLPSGSPVDVLSAEGEFARHTRSTYQTSRRKALGTILLSVPVLAVLQAVDNPEVFPSDGGDLRWRELLGASSIPLDRATDVALALLAVEATLSIALALAAPRPAKRHDVRTYAGAFAWAHMGVVVAGVTSAVALAVALSQIFNSTSRQEPAMVVVLCMLALLSVALSAAVTHYTGQELYDTLQTRRSLRALESSERWLPRSPEVEGRRSRTGSVGFAAWAGVGSSVAFLTVQAIADSASGDALPLPLRFLAGALLGGLLAAMMVGLTTDLWRMRRGTSAVDLWTSRIIRSGFVLGLTATLVGAGVASGSSAVWLQLALLWAGGFGVPGVLLWVARRFGRGPALFAVRAHVDWEARRRRELTEKLREREADGAAVGS